MKKVIIALLTVLALACVLTSCASVKDKYRELDLELKNKTGKVITEVYFYAAGSKDKGANLITNYVNYDGKTITDGRWLSGKGGVYMFGYLIRPVADAYTLEVVFEDGQVMSANYPFAVQDDGKVPNEISMKGYEDALDNWEYSWDDNVLDPEDDFTIALTAAHEANMPFDGFIPKGFYN